MISPHSVRRGDVDKLFQPENVVDAVVYRCVMLPACAHPMDRVLHAHGGDDGPPLASAGATCIKYTVQSVNICRAPRFCRGYMDDAYNTDHAWLETTVYQFHCPRKLALQLPV